MSHCWVPQPADLLRRRSMYIDKSSLPWSNTLPWTPSRKRVTRTCTQPLKELPPGCQEPRLELNSRWLCRCSSTPRTTFLPNANRFAVYCRVKKTLQICLALCNVNPRFWLIGCLFGGGYHVTSRLSRSFGSWLSASPWQVEKEKPLIRSHKVSTWWSPIFSYYHYHCHYHH